MVSLKLGLIYTFKTNENAKVYFLNVSNLAQSMEKVHKLII